MKVSVKVALKLFIAVIAIIFFFFFFSITHLQLFFINNRTRTFTQPSLFIHISRNLSNHLPYGVLKLPTSNIACQEPKVFNYDYGSGGFGDCIKGIIAVAQISYLLGCPFEIDFSNHPFKKILPISKDLDFSDQGREKILSVNILDWSTGAAAIHRLHARDNLYSKMLNETFNLIEMSIKINANVPHSRELARALHLDEVHVISLGRLVLECLYSHIILGSNVGMFWPKSSDTAFRIGIHIRMGDMYIEDATIKTDVRIHDVNDLLKAMKLMSERAKFLAGNKSILFFVCADTKEARKFVRDALLPFHVVEPSSDPVHIGYEKSFESRSRDSETLSVVQEHLTLSTASAIFVGSRSGFSMTACALAAVKGAVCFIRNGDDWISLEPGEGVYF